MKNTTHNTTRTQGYEEMKSFDITAIHHKMTQLGFTFDEACRSHGILLSSLSSSDLRFITNQIQKRFVPKPCTTSSFTFHSGTLAYR